MPFNTQLEVNCPCYIRVDGKRDSRYGLSFKCTESFQQTRKEQEAAEGARTEKELFRLPHRFEALEYLYL